MDYNNSGFSPRYSGGVSVASQTNAVMKKVYLRMFIGMLISAFVALGVASSPAAISLFLTNRIVYWIMFGAMFVMAIMIPARMNRMSTGAVFGCFLVYSALMGAFLAPIFLVYRMGTIATTFFITSGTFGAMSVYGYLTKTDLSRFGAYLTMALLGLMIAIVVNIFLKSSGMQWIISIVGVLIFVGLTAWDTQQVRRLAAANLDPTVTDKLATMAAMNLYLDFINMFLFILQLFGGNRD